jgi:predicted DNA-binding transcriptional regulator AlpA
MVEYEFLFVVDGVSVESDADVGVIFKQFDGLLSAHHGRHLLAVSYEGRTALDAANRLVAALRRALPGIRLHRLDPDLVGVSDIAERTEHSRQNVLQWVNGERRAERPFPAPEGTVGRSLAWRWGDVNAWLAQHGEGDDVLVPTRQEALDVDFRLRGWQAAIDDGRPLINVLVPQDGHAKKRAEVARTLDGVLHAAEVHKTIAALPRMDATRLVVACAVLTDPLHELLAEIAPDAVSGLLAVRTDDDLRLIGIAAQHLTGTRPISELGLSREATVGDLVLALAATKHASSAPLALA